MLLPPDVVGDGQALAPQVLRCGGKRGCGKLKSIDEFALMQNGKLRSLCLECMRAAGREYVRAHRAEDPERVRRMNLWRLYKMRVADYGTPLDLRVLGLHAPDSVCQLAEFVGQRACDCLVRGFVDGGLERDAPGFSRGNVPSACARSAHSSRR